MRRSRSKWLPLFACLGLVSGALCVSLSQRGKHVIGAPPRSSGQIPLSSSRLSAPPAPSAARLATSAGPRAQRSPALPREPIPAFLDLSDASRIANTFVPETIPDVLGHLTLVDSVLRYAATHEDARTPPNDRALELYDANPDLPDEYDEAFMLGDAQVLVFRNLDQAYVSIQARINTPYLTSPQLTLRIDDIDSIDYFIGGVFAVPETTRAAADYFNDGDPGHEICTYLLHIPREYLDIDLRYFWIDGTDYSCGDYPDRERTVPYIPCPDALRESILASLRALFPED
ncbi:MAG TPA: hypothetical protein ENJ09_12490 [Planctomycetes bacterium]|nr:hypothetical protein [Planctomycetota bacterium]